MKILRAIVAGERDRRRLAALRDVRTKANEETIAKALEGDYRAEHLFALKQSLESQLEAISQKRLKHLMELLKIRGMLGLSFNVISLSVHPIRSTRNLTIRHVVHQRNHDSQRNVARYIRLATWKRPDTAAACTGRTWFDRRYFEGQPSLVFIL